MQRIISILLVILICVSIASCSSNRVDDEDAYVFDETREDIYEENNSDLSLNNSSGSSTGTDDWYQEGMYKVGTDIPAGEYYIENTRADYFTYFAISSDSSGDSILENENFYGHHYVTLRNGEYFELSTGRMTNVENIKLNINVNDLTVGMYRVGKDIPVGEYKLVKTQGDFGYFATYDNATGDRDIEENENFKDNYYITVTKGTYLYLERCKASLVNKNISKSENDSSSDVNNSNQSEDSSSKVPTKTYGLNETWVVPGRFEFKITSVERHYVCGTWNSMDVADPQDAVIVHFEVKNLGISPTLNINNSYDIDELYFEIYDENGQEGDIRIPRIYCDHDKGDTSVLVGGKVSSSYAAMLWSKSDTVTVVVNNGVEYKYKDKSSFATFVCKVTNSQSVEKPTDNTEKQPEDSIEEDETKWTFEEASNIHTFANNAYSYYQTANDYLTDAGNTTDLRLKMPRYQNAINYISKTRLELKSALNIINENENVSLTGGDYGTIKEHVEATIKMCEELEKVEFTQDNCKSLHGSFVQDAFDMGIKCFGLISITLKMKEAFN